MAPKAKSPVDAMIKKVAADAAEAAIAEREIEKLGKDEDQRPPIDEEHGPFAEMPPLEDEDLRIPGGLFSADYNEEDAEVDSLFRSIPSEQGYYFKLHKEIAPNQWEFKMRIDDYSGWSDVESEIANIVKHYTPKHPRAWGSGKYRLMLYRQGYGNIRRKPITVHIDADDVMPETIVAQKGAGAGVMDNLQFVGDLVGAVKNITGPGMDINKVMPDLIKMSMDLVKSSNPQQPVQTQSSTAEMITMMTGMMKMMKEMGLVGGKEEKKEDFLETIAKLKAAGLIPEKEPKHNPMEIVRQTVGLMSEMRPLMEAGGGEGSTGFTRILELLAPSIPEMVGNITGTVRSVAEVSKARMMNAAGQPVPAMLPPGMHPSQPSMPPPAGGHVNPVIKKIVEAIETNDEKFFPELKSTMVSFINPSIIDSIHNGTVRPDDLLAQLASMFNMPIFTSDKTKDYFRRFLAWTKPVPTAVKPAEQAPVVGVSAVCQKCGYVFGFDNQESLDAELRENNVCGEQGCDGIIIAAPEKTASEAAAVNNNGEGSNMTEEELTPGT